jgi:hypothetical protein
MSDRTKFSFSRAINSLLKRNCLLDAEAVFDNEIRRRAESTEVLHQLRANLLPNDLSFTRRSFLGPGAMFQPVRVVPGLSRKKISGRLAICCRG